MIKGGVDEKYLKAVRELKNYYYVEDIAAAAIQLSMERAERGAEGEEVRRRSLIHTHFIPLKTKEALPTRVRGKPRQVSQPAEAGQLAAHGTLHKPQHHQPKKPAQGGQQPSRGQSSQRGQSGRNQPGRGQQQGAQSQSKPSGQRNQPGRGAGQQAQPKNPVQGGQQPSRGQSGRNQPGRGQQQGAQSQSKPSGQRNQPGRSQGTRPQRHHGSPARQDDRRNDR